MHNAHGIESLLSDHPEVKFVSLTAIDIGGNDIDERIPVSRFLESLDDILEGGVQTDGSSVVLPGIATLNNAKVDIVADLESQWYVDHNYEHLDFVTGLPVGTLRIPSFLVHDGKFVDSRALLKRAVDANSRRIRELLYLRPDLLAAVGVSAEDVSEVCFTVGTELEFWVKTPGEMADIEQLSVSQVLHEQYWKRTKGHVRTALEESLVLLEMYGLMPEMGHKEVGGVKARVEGSGQLGHIMEQLEIDWKYSDAISAADNELLARILIKETFRRHGLDVTFMAKPIEGVAGSGEHTHIGVVLCTKQGAKLNLFTAPDTKRDYLSVFGWGALMGILHNYEVEGTLVTCTNDAFNRLQPGFEAPVAIVTSLGHTVDSPSRNRSVLVGLIRDMKKPMATRFEVRSPNPHTNTYLAVAAFLQSAYHGMEYAVRSEKTSHELYLEVSKQPGEPSNYLRPERAYRSEEDVFEHFNEQQRRERFGKPPATVWEALQTLETHKEQTEVLLSEGVFTRETLESFRLAMLTLWMTELYSRIIPENVELVRSCTRLHDETCCSDFDRMNWDKIQQIRRELVQSSTHAPSLFSEIRSAIKSADYETVSALQVSMARKIKQLKGAYLEYKRNMLEIAQ